MTNTLPAWLEQHITDTTGQRPGTRNTKPSRCHRCKARILVGLSDDTLAFTAWVDPTPLTPTGEALAHLTGRRTYALRRHLDRYRLHTRDRWQITGQPAGTSNTQRMPYDVFADHACHQPLPSTSSAHQPTASTSTDPDAPPPF